MLRNVFLSLVIVALAVTSSSATILSTDGDFGQQTIGSTISSGYRNPWQVGGSPTATATSQSPFINVFSNNGIGANFDGSDYLIGYFASQTAQTSPMLYFNFDVKLNETDLLGDYYRHFALTLNSGAEIMFDAFVGTKSLLISDGSGGYATATDELEANTWYNLQLAFDLTAMTYSGVIATESESFEIATQSINSPTTGGYRSWNGTVNNFFTDTNVGGRELPDSCDVDNFALSTSPFAAVPEPSMIMLLLGGISSVLLIRRYR